MFNNDVMLTRHDIESLIARIEPALIALRRRIHQHPELAFEEHETARAVSDYLASLDIPLKRGRDFTDRDIRDGAPVAIVNETTATRYWP